MHVEESVEINRPLEEVFDYTANPENLPEWTGPVIEVRDLQKSSSGQLQEGGAFTLVAKFLGRRCEAPTEVTTYEPNQRLSYRGIGGPVPTEVTFIFEEVPGGTRFTQSQEAEPGGFFRLTGPIFERAAKRQS